MLAAVMVGVVMRALIPAGYMLAGPDSKTLFVLCPDRLPQALVASMAGTGHDHHGHHDSGAEAPAADTCDVGHLLTVAAVADDALMTQAAIGPSPHELSPNGPPVISPINSRRSSTSTRAARCSRASARPWASEPPLSTSKGELQRTPGLPFPTPGTGT